MLYREVRRGSGPLKSHPPFILGRPLSKDKGTRVVQRFRQKESCHSPLNINRLAIVPLVSLSLVVILDTGTNVSIAERPQFNLA